MTAFDTAWALMKMPLMPETIHRVKTDPLFESEYRAKFYDPKSDEEVPMSVGITRGGHQSIEGHIGDNESRAWSYAQHEPRLGDNIMQAKDVQTKQPYQRRGYATALYHLMAHALANKDRGWELHRDSMQSREAEEMWRKHSGLYDENWDPYAYGDDY